MPNVEDMFGKLAGVERFSEIDLRLADAHLPLEECRRKHTTINTHKVCMGIRGYPLVYYLLFQN